MNGPDVPNAPMSDERAVVAQAAHFEVFKLGLAYGMAVALGRRPTIEPNLACLLSSYADAVLNPLTLAELDAPR